MATKKRIRVMLTCKDKTRTIQSAKKECDINEIMANWKRTGVISHGQTQAPRYDDLTVVAGDYHTATNEILAADEAFMALPAAVRKSFHNNPGELLDNLEEPATLEILHDAGLLNPEREKPKDEKLSPTAPERDPPPAAPAPPAPPSAPLGQ